MLAEKTYLISHGFNLQFNSYNICNVMISQKKLVYYCLYYVFVCAFAFSYCGICRDNLTLSIVMVHFRAAQTVEFHHPNESC
jgi:hypothetical protein